MFENSFIINNASKKFDIIVPNYSSDWIIDTYIEMNY